MKQRPPTSPNAWDYVVIGAGSAGCAVAHELVCANAGRVLLIEAGGSDKSPLIRVPVLVTEAVKTFDWGYVSEPDASREGRREGWARGRVLGGSSSINGMMFVRGARNDFDRWAAKQIPGWAWEDVAPIYKALETSDQRSEERGRAGPLAVRTVRRPHRLTRAFLDAAESAGYPINPDYNARSQEGVSLAQLSQRNGERFSAADAFVRPLRDNQNLTVWTDCAVERLRFEGRRVVSAIVRRAGVAEEVHAANFILSAGAVGTPKLLLQSGVGEAAALKAIGIDPVVDAPEVGRNLAEHPLVRLVYETKVQSNNLTGGPLQSAGIFAKYMLFRQGVMASVFEGIGFLKSKPELDHPDLQLHFLPFGVLDPVLHEAPRLNVPSVTIYVNLSYPQGRGRLSLRSIDPDAPPLIASKLLGDAADVEAMVRGVEIVRGIMNQDPMSKLVKREIKPGPEQTTAEELRAYLPSHTEIAYHIVGTCRMGTDPQAVVSSDLKINGVENAWIADASIMPDLISGNTNAVCMMIGMKLGRALSSRRVR
ncbi:MAG TPA: GMC family oxidoreductase N-terminal domain-containing protein [Verrucomicrobiae bacterium]|nr:GMC family oxidoreductase N-terminal domain-containing protein [Verrucomicrobiae bacterium]